MQDEEIEYLENKYLKKIYYTLCANEDKILEGLESKEDIRSDWEKYSDKETSDIATGAERIFYSIFNDFGKPNSSPVASDLFFETEDAYVHIDIKTVRNTNIGDINRNIFIGKNQTSYTGYIITKKDKRLYECHLPTFYKKRDGEEKICLTYFICILYNENTYNIETIFITCMPNGELYNTYNNEILSAGKNPPEARFNFLKCKYFKCLENNELRIKIFIWNPEIEDQNKLKGLEEIYKEQEGLL